jgi:hypothetical protein
LRAAVRGGFVIATAGMDASAIGNVATLCRI